MKLRAAGYISAVMLLALLTLTAEAVQKSSLPVKDESLRRGESSATLDPAQFRDTKVKDAYKVAREIPWVLDGIYCYCQCEESPAFRHKSLLSCYVDNHAAV
ncbi:MAG: hypothetical protein HZB33_14945 [Nitrospirae bacterium]|nr:hypothetical protein [Nitrospirota bacterium]